jgi:hypothetical protein
VKAGIFKHPKSVSHGVCAGESGDFQQLRSISHGLCAGESGEFQQLRSTSHGPLAGESGNHMRFIHVFKNLMMIRSSHVMQIKNDALVKVGNDGDSGLHVEIGLQSGSCSVMHASHSWCRKWKIRIHYRRYRSCTTWLTTSNRFIASPTRIVHECLLNF